MSSISNELKPISMNEIILNTSNRIPDLIICMIKHMDKDNNIFIASHKEIAKEILYSASNVYVYIQSLKKLGYIRKLGTNTYMVNPLLLCNEVDDLVEAKYKVFMNGKFDFISVANKLIKENMGE